MPHTDDSAPGWDAIDAALQPLYPGVEPLHYGTVVKWMLGGPDPLDGISVYRRPDHWHFVTYGMSELYAKESENTDESGWGFEFTFRLARTDAETEPPAWAVNFLQNLARYVFDSGNPFAPGHHLDLNGPIALSQPDTLIRAVAFTEDPELGAVATPHGRLRFLQIVGLTVDEYAALERWDAERLLATLATHLPLLVTDLGRGDLSDQPGIEDGARRDGSSTGSLFVAEAGWDSTEAATTVTFGANAADRIRRVLLARLPYDRGLLVQARDSAVGFRPAGRLAVTDAGDGRLEIGVPPEVLPDLADALRPVAGTHRLAGPPELTVRIVKSQIRDQDGAVVAEIG